MGNRLIPFIPDGYVEYDNLSDEAKNEIIDSVGESVGNNVTYDESPVPNKFVLGKQVYHKMINFGALPMTAGSKSVAHGISAPYKIISITGIASSDINELPLPYVDVSNNQNSICVLIRRSDNKASVIVGVDRSAFNAYITIEYIKDNL